MAKIDFDLLNLVKEQDKTIKRYFIASAMREATW